MAELTTNQNERLSLIRYQLGLAREQSRKPVPLSSLALSYVQDAVESSLMLAGEQLNADIKVRADFMQLFDAVVGKVPDNTELAGFRTRMNAVNSARVSFKHHGNVADSSTVNRSVENGIEFVAALSRVVHQTELEQVSLLVFVRNQGVRDALQMGSELKLAGKHNDAAEQFGIAFHLLVKDYQERKSWYPGNSLFTTKPSFIPSPFDHRALGKSMEKAYEWLESLDDWVRNLALGIDMRRYAYFRTHTPRLTFAMGGRHFTHFYDGIEITDESLDRCFRFVVDTALAFAEDDFDFDPWTARRLKEEDTNGH